MLEFIVGWMVGKACTPSEPISEEEYKKRLQAFDSYVGTQLPNMTVGPGFYSGIYNMSSPLVSSSKGLEAVTHIKDGVAYNPNWTTK